MSDLKRLDKMTKYYGRKLIVRYTIQFILRDLCISERIFCFY